MIEMNIENVRYGNEENTQILADIDDVEHGIPVYPGNRHYDYIVANNIEIAPYASPMEP